MCGIAGFVDWRAPRPRAEAAAIVGAMATAIAHRGPDGAGVWVSPDGAVALAHRRLAIVDLSPTGAQPMVSPSGRYVVTFNGEIYNHGELRRDLAATRLRGTSDTEVMLACFDRDGVVATLPRLIGMLALAVYDTRTRELTLARDRFGEKPLYWGQQGDSVVFGSELKAVCVYPAFTPTVDRGALVQYLRHGWVPAPRSIYVGIGKLPAGTSVTIDLANGRVGEPVAYYDLRAVAMRGLANPLRVDAVEAADRVEAALTTAVRRQMVADVPLGAFLSGGIDSSTIVALMQACATRPVHTYCIGFAERGYDESAFAADVARHLGTAHTELTATPDACLPIVPDLARIYDEPFADSSQLPTTLLARLTRAHVTVALSGDAGDELFGGYTRYALLRRVARLYAVPGRRAAAGFAGGALDRLVGATAPRSRGRQAIDFLRRRVAFAGERDLDAFYQAYLSTWIDPAAVVRGGREPPGLLPLSRDFLAGSPTERAMLADALLYLPDDVLVKVDRATMSTALESRVPFLDPAVVELAWSLPLAHKVEGDRGKRVVRDVLARHVPRRLFERPKRGFGVPLGAWLRGPLRDWAEALLAERRLRADGYLDPAPIRARWDEHLAGRRDWQSSLWVVLMWQAWREATARA